MCDKAIFCIRVGGDPSAWPWKLGHQLQAWLLLLHVLSKCVNYVSTLNNISCYGLPHFQIRMQLFHNRPLLAKHGLNYFLVNIGQAIYFTCHQFPYCKMSKVVSKATGFWLESTMVPVASGCAGPRELTGNQFASVPKVTNASKPPTAFDPI